MTVKIDTKGRDLIAGGKVYRADADGFCEIPKKVAIDEGHSAPDPAAAGDDDVDNDQNPDTGNKAPWDPK